MASSPALSTNQADADFQEHVETYDLFLTLAKWVAGFVIVLLIGMAYFLL